MLSRTEEDPLPAGIGNPATYSHKDETGLISKDTFISYMRSPPIHRTTMKQLEEQFRNFDKDGDGAITEGYHHIYEGLPQIALCWEEMSTILEETTDLKDRAVIHDMFLATDQDGDGKISFLEFVKMMQE